MTFKAPEGHRLNSATMESESGADVGQLEAPEFDPPLFVFTEPLLKSGNPPLPPCRVVDSKISHHGLNGWIIRPQEFVQLLVDDLVSDDEGCFVAVDHQACRGEVCPELVPCLYGALRQLDWICVVAIKTNVVNPAVQMQVREILLEAGEGGLQEGLGKKWSLWAARCYSRSSMKPWAEFALCQNGLVPGVDLHGKLKCQGWVVQVLGCLLESLKSQCVVESAHVQQHSDAMLLQGLFGLLSEQSF